MQSLPADGPGADRHACDQLGHGANRSDASIRRRLGRLRRFGQLSS